MSRTSVYFLGKNRMYEIQKIKAQEGVMAYRKGLYIVSPTAINKKRINRRFKKGSECFFFEGNSTPIPVTAPEAGKEDASGTYLDNMVYLNFLEQTGDPAFGRFKDKWKWIRPLTNPATLFKTVFFFVIITAMLQGYIKDLMGW